MSGLVAIGAIIMDVFSAFPGAVISGRFFIGKYQRGSLEGNQFVKDADIEKESPVNNDSSHSEKVSAAPINDASPVVEPEKTYVLLS